MEKLVRQNIFTSDEIERTVSMTVGAKHYEHLLLNHPSMSNAFWCNVVEGFKDDDSRNNVTIALQLANAPGRSWPQLSHYATTNCNHGYFPEERLQLIHLRPLGFAKLDSEQHPQTLKLFCTVELVMRDGDTESSDTRMTSTAEMVRFYTKTGQFEILV